MLDNLTSLLEEQIKDLYSAEKQLTKALPRMAKKASSEALKTAFDDHLAETEEHVERLAQIAEMMETKPSGKVCKAMQGLIEEGKEVLEEDGEDAVIDAALIGAAQRVEHYEIAAYGTARAIAEKLSMSKVVALLTKTLDEESAADEKLTTISEGEVMDQAMTAGTEESDEESDTNGRSARQSAGSRSSGSQKKATSRR